MSVVLGTAAAGDEGGLTAAGSRDACGVKEQRRNTNERFAETIRNRSDVDVRTIAEEERTAHLSVR